jgi:nitrite reductase/ring-hydroxylating ferredoxin subunit
MWNVLLARIDGAYFALNDRCSHAAQRLSAGHLRQCTITCPAHGARFDARSGSPIGNPYTAIPSFPVTVENGRVFVDVPARQPAMNEIPVN